METVISLELALERVGFGLYSYLLIVLTGLVIISFACVVYGNTILVPISACELNTTTAQQGLLAAMPNIGNILGAIFWGYLADTRGRRAMLLLSLMLGAVTNAISSLSLNWIMLLSIQFIASILVAGQFPISMTLLSECVPLDRRNLVVILVTSIFLFSQGLMAIMAIPVAPATADQARPTGQDLGMTPWRIITLIYSIPSLISFVWMFHMQESPKYVFTKGEEFRALQILNRIHRINHRNSTKTLDVTGLVRTSVAGKSGLGQIASHGGMIRPLFRKPLVKNLFIVTTLFLFQLVWPFKIWLPTMANQFVSILKSDKGSDMTLCRIIHLSLKEPQDNTCTLNVTALTLVSIVCALQSMVNILICPLVNKVGRRNMVMVITFISGFCGILVNLVPNAYGSAALFTIQLMGMIVMGYYTAIAVALFPTQNRGVNVNSLFVGYTYDYGYMRPASRAIKASEASAVTIAMTGGRVSTFASIQILNFLLANYCEVGFFVFSTIFASSSLVASMLPEEKTAVRRISPAAIRMSTSGQGSPEPKNQAGG